MTLRSASGMTMRTPTSDPIPAAPESPAGLPDVATLARMANVLGHLRHRRRLVGPPEHLPSSTALADGIRDSLAGPNDESVDLKHTHGKQSPRILRIDRWRHGGNRTRLTVYCQLADVEGRRDSHSMSPRTASGLSGEGRRRPNGGKWRAGRGAGEAESESESTVWRSGP